MCSRRRRRRPGEQIREVKLGLREDEAGEKVGEEHPRHMTGRGD